MKPDRPTLLVIGSSGQLGWELIRTLSPLGKVVAASMEGRCGPSIDLMSAESLTRLIDDVRPNLVFNASAYTAVDKAENEPVVAARINAEAVGELGRLAARDGTPVLHYSTDFVFPGDAKEPYKEDDATGPLGVYGATKLDGEKALAESGTPHLTFRTSWVYGVRGGNFLLTMLRLLREREQLRVVNDQIGAPTWSRMLAEASAQIAGRILRGEIDPAEVQGIYNMTCGGSTSWYGFARAIYERSGLSCELLPIPSSEYPTPAKRPAYSVLDNSKLFNTFGLQLPEWSKTLHQCMADLG